MRKSWNAVLFFSILAFVLVPFFLWGARADSSAQRLLSATAGKGASFFLVTAFLAADVLAPIPSSLVATLSGARLGLNIGTLATWTGMTFGSAIGYGIGSGVLSRRSRRRTEGAPQSGDLSPTTFGMVAATRGVPVLAEAVTLLAGANRLPFIPFITTSAVANLGVAAAYAWVGAKAANVNSFMLALAGSVLLPAVTLLLWRLLTRRHVLQGVNAPHRARTRD